MNNPHSDMTNKNDMPDVDQVKWFLKELECSEDIESDEIEIYGEDDQGREGSCAVKINKIAKDAHTLIEHLESIRNTDQLRELLIADVEGNRRKRNPFNDIYNACLDETIKLINARLK